MFYFEDFDNITHEEIKAIILEMIDNAKEDVHKWAEQKQENKRLYGNGNDCGSGGCTECWNQEMKEK